MRNIKPEFDKLWVQGQKEIEEYREGFVKNIENEGIDFLNSIVDDFFDKENAYCICLESFSTRQRFLDKDSLQNPNPLNKV